LYSNAFEITTIDKELHVFSFSNKDNPTKQKIIKYIHQLKLLINRHILYNQ